MRWPSSSRNAPSSGRFRQTIVFTVRQRAAVTLGSRLRRPTIYSSAISRRFSEVSVAFAGDPVGAFDIDTLKFAQEIADR